MVLLLVVALRLPSSAGQLVVRSLQTAGFLHTLMGLSAGVVAVARNWGAADAHAIGPLLAPLGSALAPHIMGVWGAHAIETRNGGFDEPTDGGVRLGAIADDSVRLVRVLHDRLKALSELLLGLTSECSAALRRTADVAKDLEGATRSAIDNARQFQKCINDVSAGTRQITVVHQQIVDLLRSRLLRWDDPGGPVS
jgi:hypothetical protein